MPSLNALSGSILLKYVELGVGNAMKNFQFLLWVLVPYITASIVVQLLQMDLLPKFVEWGKQGKLVVEN